LKQINHLRNNSQAIVGQVLVLAAKGHDQTTAIQSAAFMMVIGASAVLALLLAAIAMLVSRRIDRGLAALQQGTHRVAEGKLGHTIPLGERDELGELAAAFNRMSGELKKNQESIRAEMTAREKVSESLRQSNIQLSDALTRLERAQEEIIQQERLKGLKQMADGMLHDIYDALMPIVGYSELLLRYPEQTANPKELQDTLQTIHRAVTQAVSVARHLSEYFYPTQREDAAPANINAICESTLAVVLPSWKDGGHAIKVKTEWGQVPLLNTIEADLHEALARIMANAVEALEGAGQLTVKTFMEADQAVIEIRDTGPGMDGESRRRCLEPFYSTKGHGHSGMGLTIAQGAVTRCQGKLIIESLPGRGTTVTLRLPNILCDQADVRVAAEPVTACKLSILVVDDEAWIRQLLVQALKVEGHKVTVAVDGPAALDMFRARAFDLVIVDLAMPKMNGSEVAAAIKQIRPNTPVIMLTGFGAMLTEFDAKPAAVDFLLSKPMSLDELYNAIARVSN
jgi:signal transduction histidine kinase